MDEKRKIIEIYVIENKEEDIATFEFERCEDTEIANTTMKGLLMMFDKYKKDLNIENEIEAEFE